MVDRFDDSLAAQDANRTSANIGGRVVECPDESGNCLLGSESLEMDDGKRANLRITVLEKTDEPARRGSSVAAQLRHEMALCPVARGAVESLRRTP